LTTEAERKHRIEALTSGAMSEVWAWVRGRIPPGVDVFDAHAHIGADVDGRTMTAEGMRERMLAAGVTRSVVFPLNDPNAREDYSGPNDVIWKAHEDFPGFFVPFFRLNPHSEYEKEFERCVERGFMGLKLHPVSQNFELDDERVLHLLGMSAGAGLPALIHTGFAMQRVVKPLRLSVEAHPELRVILGHSSMVEVLEAVRAFEENPNVLFETSVVSAKDLYVLFSSVDAGRVCYGSDIPYGDIPSTLHATLSAAEAAGVPREQIPAIVSGNIRRWFP
jgi:predicted TIM-barrel fold metal-dependent hydrolase